MQITNFEFKAKLNQPGLLEEKLKTLDPQFKGTDHQTDTYFNVPIGRLKLREGNIENALIYYERENDATAKASKILLYTHQPDPTLKQILVKTHGIKIIVDKIRKIYFVDNVKFHFDTVAQLGTFIEVEAIDHDGSIGLVKLKEQCDYYKQFFHIPETDFVAFSYSDLLLRTNLPINV